MNSSDFWLSVASNFIADALIAVLFGLIIDRIFGLRKERNQQKKLESENRDKLKLASNLLHEEIKFNYVQLFMLIENLPKGNFILPALEVSAWETVDKVRVIDGLKYKDVSDLLNIYNRTKVINSMYDALLNNVEWITDGKKSVVKRDYINAIVDRAEELILYIENVFPHFKSR